MQCKRKHEEQWKSRNKRPLTETTNNQQTSKQTNRQANNRQIDEQIKRENIKKRNPSLNVNDMDETPIINEIYKKQT